MTMFGSVARRFAVGATVAGVAGGLFLVGGVPAQASTTLSAWGRCHQADSLRSECYAGATGGVAPYTFTWAPWNPNGNSGADVIMYCPDINLEGAITVTATDAVGNRSTSVVFGC